MGPLCALLVLLGTGFAEMSKILYSEVIVPKKLEPRGGGDSKVEESYLIKIAGHHRIVHLQQRIEFIVEDLPVFTYDEKGDLITDYPYIQTDCYYEGFVEDVPGSVVSLSTCSGLSGLLKVEDINYDIEPIENSSTFQHLIFQVAADGDSPDHCGVTGDFIENQPAEERELPTNESRKVSDDIIPSLTSTITSLEMPEDYDPRYHTLYGHTRYLEFFLTSDRQVYKRFEENETKVLNSMLLLTSILNTMYKSLNVRIVLIGTEIWTEVDHITVTHLLDHAFHFFAPWARQFLKPRIYFDHAQLLLGRHYRGTLGLATQGTVCNTDASTSIIRFSDNRNIYNAAGSAHELGHALIFGHDDEAGNAARFCRCPGCREKCIMRSKLSECTEFSNCSAADFYDRLMMGKLNCLLNMPPIVTLTYNQCGNGLLEEDEECDCGRDKVCRDNGCCQSNCTLAPGVTCVSGHCCTKCQFDHAGKLCRDIGDECDLPEYCNGISHLCPEDVFRQDGSPCGKSDMCFQGKCNNHERQCKAIFGKDAHRAPLSCFREVNLRGDRCGNCGWDGLAYTKCAEKDVLCGRVQCVNVKSIPVKEDYETTVQTPINNTICWGREFHLGPDVSDVGSVKDGTLCDKDQICINRTCVSTNILEYYCRDEKCNGQGICNSNGNCHCNFGWAPPNCTEKGFGGSLDSGPPPATSVTSSNAFLIGIIVGSVILLLVIIIVVFSIAYRFLRSDQKTETSQKKTDSSASVGKGSQK